MKKICICGHFAFGENKLNGQTVKTKVVSSALSECLNRGTLSYIDTGVGILGILMLPLKLFYAALTCRHIVVLPAYKGVQVIIPLLAFFRLFFRFSIHYVVIGGWLPFYMDDKPILRTCLRHSVDYIYPETSVVVDALRKRGCRKIVRMPNFKKMKLVNPSESLLKNKIEGQLRLCTFSRVMRQKGIEDAVDAVRIVNEKLKKDVFSLTIFGPVWSTESDWFEGLKSRFPSYVKYGGAVPFESSVDVLQSFYALLFPTRFFTEGIPGTIIDAYAAGIPVISSRWESFSDVVEDGKTGLGYTFADVNSLVAVLLEVASEPCCLISMSPSCVRKAREFVPENVIPILLEHLT